MPEQNTHIVLLPGLGGDKRMFDAQRERFPLLYTPDWIEPRPKESLPDYAKRLADTLPVKDGRPLLLGGASFGGMVAREVARHLDPDALVLIGSAHHPTHVPALARHLSKNVAWVMSKGIYQRAKPLGRLLTRPFGVHEHKDERELFLRMLREAEPDFLRWAAGAVGRWQAPTLDDVPVYRVHGGNDLILPKKDASVHGPIHIVKGAGHLVNMTHKDEVNEFLSRIAKQLHALADADEARP